MVLGTVIGYVCLARSQLSRVITCESGHLLHEPHQTLYYHYGNT